MHFTSQPPISLLHHLKIKAMNKVSFITEADFKLLLQRLTKLESAVKAKQDAELAQLWVDCQQLKRMLRVSGLTLKLWRDAGLITYSQVGSNLFYRYSDVEAMLQNHKKLAVKSA